MSDNTRRPNIIGSALLWAAALWMLILLWGHESQGDPQVFGRYSVRLFATLLLSSAGLAAIFFLGLKKRLTPAVIGLIAAHRATAFLIWLAGLAPAALLVLRLPPFAAAIWGFWLLLGLAVCLSASSEKDFFFRTLKLKAVLLNTALSLVVCALCLVAAEFLFRYWLANHAQPGIAAKCDPRAADPRTWFFGPHHYLNYVPRPNWKAGHGQDMTNSLGFRGPREIVQPKPAGQFRIATLGGSTTYSSVKNWEDSYPHQLEVILRKTKKAGDVRVINAGVPGYDSFESLLNLEFRVLDLTPDLVIIYQGTNDVHTRLVRPAYYRGDNSARRRQWDQCLVNSWAYRMPSAILRYVADRLQLLSNEIDALVQGPWTKPGLSNDDYNQILGMTPMEAMKQNPPVYFRRNLNNMLAILKANGVKALLVTFAFRKNKGYAGTKYHDLAIAQHNGITRELAAKWGASLVDLRRLMPMDAKYWRTDGIHFTPEGNRVRAELIARHLLEQGILAAPGKASPKSGSEDVPGGGGKASVK